MIALYGSPPDDGYGRTNFKCFTCRDKGYVIGLDPTNPIPCPSCSVTVPAVPEYTPIAIDSFRVGVLETQVKFLETRIAELEKRTAGLEALKKQVNSIVDQIKNIGKALFRIQNPRGR